MCNRKLIYNHSKEGLSMYLGKRITVLLQNIVIRGKNLVGGHITARFLTEMLAKRGLFQFIEYEAPGNRASNKLKSFRLRLWNQAEIEEEEFKVC